MLESLTDFAIAIGIIWLLCIATMMISQIRDDSPLDDDIRDDWQNVRTAIRIFNTTIKTKWRNK